MQTEAQIQQEIVVWFRNKYCRKGLEPRYCIFSVPNEAGYKNRQFMLTGMLPGVSDLIIVLDQEVIFVELKDHKGRQSPKQKEFEKMVLDLGHSYFLVRSLEDFKKTIENIVHI